VEALVAWVETPVVCRLAGLSASTLDYWTRTGLVSPSVRGSAGRRVTRRWSVQDAVVVRAVKALRDAGCPMRKLRDAQARLRDDWEPALRGRHLYWDGEDLLRIGPWDEVESLVRRPGQQVFKLVALPVDAWAEETVAVVTALQRPQADRVVPRQTEAS
jgi:DNA-binding transcriptional MerR regulator